MAISRYASSFTTKFLCVCCVNYLMLLSADMSFNLKKNMLQYRPCTYVVTLRCVQVTILAVK